MRNERAERERVARRWAVASGLFFTLMYTLVVAFQVERVAERACTRDLYGAYRPSHYCAFDEALAWVEAGASPYFWVFAVLFVATGIAFVVIWLRSLRAE